MTVKARLRKKATPMSAGSSTLVEPCGWEWGRDEGESTILFYLRPDARARLG
jgi:hypothetical protein